MVVIPDGAECAMIPSKWLPVLQKIAHGPFIPLDFPLPIVVSKMVPDDEIWFARMIKITGEDSIEIISKEKLTNETFKTDDVDSIKQPDEPEPRLLSHEGPSRGSE